jgi:uncharacterized membrane protein YfcA
MDIAAGTGLFIVLLNALSGVIGLIKQKRISYSLGIILTVSAIPGTFFGSWLAQIVSSQAFYKIFASLLIGLAAFLFYKNSTFFQKKNSSTSTKEEHFLKIDGMLNKRTLGLLGIDFLLGTVSNFFGIGGGWLLVPILIYGFHIKPHISTATSLFSLGIYVFFWSSLFRMGWKPRLASEYLGWNRCFIWCTNRSIYI